MTPTSGILFTRSVLSSMVTLIINNPRQYDNMFSELRLGTLLQQSEYKKIRADRYASYDAGQGKDFEQGKLSLEDLRNIAISAGVPATISGKQEFIENLINRYI